MDQERKSQLLKVAKQLFSRFGFKKTTVDEIAEAAGMSKRTVYGVFDNKEQILAELVISVATAKAHVARLFTKLGARDRVHLVIVAYGAGLVSPSG